MEETREGGGSLPRKKDARVDRVRGNRDGERETKRSRPVRSQRTPAASQMNPLSLLAESLGVRRGQPRV